jgi:DHA1 family tetracycline resistance protein-like MFS transporter
MDKKRLFNIFLIVFIDLLGFGLILPLLPFYAESYGATPTLIGLLTASYAAAQLIGAPWLGRLSDRYGRRPVLLISILGTFLSLLLLGGAEFLGTWLAGTLNNGMASSSQIYTFILVLLFTSRILDGLTGGNISVAQAYITDITDERSRASGLGLIGAAFGLGFIFGPAVGGFLSGFGYSVPAFAAAGLAGINLISVYLALPESLSLEDREKNIVRNKPAFSFQSLYEALTRPRVGPLLQIRFFFGLAFSMFQTIFPLYALYRLGLDATQTGFILTYVGILAAFVQGFAVGRLVNRYPENRLILVSSAVMGVALAAWAVTWNVWVLLVVLAPIAFAGGVLNTVLSSSLTKSVHNEEVGGILGLSTSVESTTRVIAPSAGGFLLGQVGTWAPGLVGTLLMAWVTIFAWRKLVVNPDPPLESGQESLAPASSMITSE